MHIFLFPQDVWVKCPHSPKFPLLGMQVPLWAHAAERRCRYSSFICTFYQLPASCQCTCLEREPCEFVWRDKPEQWLFPACPSLCCSMPICTAGNSISDRQAALAGWHRGVMPERWLMTVSLEYFDSHLFPLIALCLLLHISTLPSEAVESPSLEIFKNHLDVILCNVL